MSTYAVVNPATNETIKEYPEISDAALQAAIGAADAAARTWSAGSKVAERSELIREVGRLHVERRQTLAEIAVREMGKPIEQALGEVDFAGAIYTSTAENAEKLMADEPIELLVARAQRSFAAAHTACCSGSCPGTTPTTRWHGSPAPTT